MLGGKMHFMVALLLILMRSFPCVCAYYLSKGQCTPSQQREALSDANSCEPRPTLINLQDHLSDMNDVIQVIPEYKHAAPWAVAHGTMGLGPQAQPHADEMQQGV